MDPSDNILAKQFFGDKTKLWDSEGNLYLDRGKTIFLCPFKVNHIYHTKGVNREDSFTVHQTLIITGDNRTLFVSRLDCEPRQIFPDQIMRKAIMDPPKVDVVTDWREQRVTGYVLGINVHDQLILLRIQYTYSKPKNKIISFHVTPSIDLPKWNDVRFRDIML